MYYYLYEVKNLSNDKIYIGVHQTSNLEDGYIGSGSHIKNAIKKYGKEKFHKTILEFFIDSESMYLREAEIVNQEFLNRSDVYNKKLGGPANFYFVNKNKMNHKVDQHLIHGNKCLNDPEYRKKFVQKMTIINKANGYKQSQRLLTNNHNKGRFWISNNLLQKSILTTSIEFEILQNKGWERGCKYRKKRVK